jgi:hypothetical protein
MAEENKIYSDLDFKGWTLWKMPPKESIVGQVSSER